MASTEFSKVTTFRLTASMQQKMDEIRAYDGRSKDAVIRELLHLGLLVHDELQSRVPSAVRTIARGLLVHRGSRVRMGLRK